MYVLIISPNGITGAEKLWGAHVFSYVKNSQNSYILNVKYFFFLYLSNIL
jgi:hypothetical protein